MLEITYTAVSSVGSTHELVSRHSISPVTGVPATGDATGLAQSPAASAGSVVAIHPQPGRPNSGPYVEGILLPGIVEGFIAHQTNDDLGRDLSGEQSIHVSHTGRRS